MMGSNHPTDAGGTPERKEETTVRDTAADLMPWLATILLHAGMVLIAVLFVWATLDRTEVEENVVPVITSDMRPSQSLAMREISKAEQQQKIRDRSVTVHYKSPDNRRSLDQPIDMAIIRNIGLGNPASSPFGEGERGLGSDGIFDPRRDGPGARSFVFVIDASGSMIDTLPFVVAELKRTLRSLSDQHTFAVIFYQGDQIIESLGGGLKPATHETVQRTFDWLDGDALSPSGLSDPIGAVERGLRLKPQVLYLLSDNITGSGRYEINQDFLLKRIARANIGKTKINTIQFLYPDPLTRIPGMKPTLERISEESDGRYRFLSAKDLGL